MNLQSTSYIHPYTQFRSLHNTNKWKPIQVFEFKCVSVCGVVFCVQRPHMLWRRVRAYKDFSKVEPRNGPRTHKRTAILPAPASQPKPAVQVYTTHASCSNVWMGWGLLFDVLMSSTWYSRRAIFHVGKGISLGLPKGTTGAEAGCKKGMGSMGSNMSMGYGMEGKRTERLKWNKLTTENNSLTQKAIAWLKLLTALA